VELALTNLSGGKDKSNSVEVSPITFGRDFNESLVHQVVVAHLASARSGTRAQKTRSDVRGGGIKPWRQKGNGRARAGSIRSPIWRGGGATFASRPQDHTKKVNKKMYRSAMQSILSELVRQDKLVLVDSLVIDEPKTKLLLQKLKDMGLSECLMITDSWQEELYLASRNLPNVDYRIASGIDPLGLLKFDKVLLTVAAIRKLEEVLG